MPRFGSIELAFVLLVVFVAWVMFSPSSPKNRR
jgi:hypothetical protein